MKARVASIGDPAKASKFAVIGAEFDIVNDNIQYTPQGPAFYIHSPIGQVYCFIIDCKYLGGVGGEWEIVRDNPNDDYDRAMGIL